MKRTTSRSPARRKPSANARRAVVAARTNARRIRRDIENPESSSSSSDNDDTGDIENPEEHIFSPTIPIKEAQKKDQERKRIYASKQHSMPLIPIKEAQKKDKQRQMNYFAKENINYNPNRNFPQRINDSAILANKRPPRRNKTRKKRDTSLKSLKNRPPGMGGRRKTRRKKRRKTKTKKKRRKRKHKTRKRRR